MKKIKLSNNVHGTSVTVTARDGIISRRSMQCARRKLCSVPDCQCGVITHGPILQERANGSAKIVCSIDIRSGVPAGYVQIPGRRRMLTCRAQRIHYAQALTGFEPSWKNNKQWRPVFDGVIVRKADEEKLLAALERARLNTIDARAARKAREAKRRQADIEWATECVLEMFPSIPQEDAEECAKRWYEMDTDPDMDSKEMLRRMVIAHARHQTSYDDMLSRRVNREDARVMVSDDMTEIIDAWSEPK